MDSKENLSSMSASNPKSKELGEFLLGALDHHFAFHFFDTETKWRFVEAMREERANMGEWVMHQVSSTRVVEAVCLLALGIDGKDNASLVRVESATHSDNQVQLILSCMYKSTNTG